MPGAGNQGAGTTPAGGYTETLPNPAGAALPDPGTGLSRSGRLIDPKTRSFVSTPDGRFEGQSTVAQIVQIAWGTIDPSTIGPFDSGYQNRARAAYLAAPAVKNLINLGMLQVVSFRLDRFGTGGLRVTVRWRDLSAGVEGEFQR